MLWGKTDAIASVPKFINLTNYPAGTRLVFVDIAEANVPENKARGLNSPGWWLYRTYTDGNGAVRHKAEKLISFSSTATATASLDTQSDDDVLKDFLIAFTTQPSAQTVAQTQTATFTGVVTPLTGTTYQWEQSVNGGTTWTLVTNGGGFTGATTASLAIVTTLAMNARQYRLVASNVSGSPATSNTALLTVTA